MATVPSPTFEREEAVYKSKPKKQLKTLAKQRENVSLNRSLSRATKTDLIEALLAADGIVTAAVAEANAKIAAEANALEQAALAQAFKFTKFFELPPELRLVIYDHYFLAIDRDRKSNLEASSLPVRKVGRQSQAGREQEPPKPQILSNPREPALLTVNHQVRTEALPLYYSSAECYIKMKKWPGVYTSSAVPFYLGLTNHTMDFFSKLNPNKLAMIKRWTVVIEGAMNTYEPFISIILGAQRDKFAVKVYEKDRQLSGRVKVCMDKFMAEVVARGKANKWLPIDARTICKEIRQALAPA